MDVEMAGTCKREREAAPPTTVAMDVETRKREREAAPPTTVAMDVETRKRDREAAPPTLVLSNFFFRVFRPRYPLA